MQHLAANPAPLVREVRGWGLMIGIELRQRVTPVLQRLVDRGVLALPAGPTVLRLLPPLVIQESELETVLEAVQEVLEIG
jgi:acetylornithine/LysW-gamma-L-lysine aminotransferase